MYRPIIHGQTRNLERVIRFTIITAVQFVLLTLVAMLFYPGGTGQNPDSRGYDFLRNFFSDLGLTVAHNGEPNTLSMILFMIALSLAGLGLILFFVVWPRYFWHSWLLRGLSVTGSFFGIGAGISFIGVAFTPANLLLEAHVDFVFAAFISFFVAALFYSLAIFRNIACPNRYGIVFLVFTVLLGTYVWLLFNGPETSTDQGLIIQVVAQKTIAYASIISLFIQATGAQTLLEQAKATVRPKAIPVES